MRFLNRLARGEVLEKWAGLRPAPTIRDWESSFELTRTYFITGHSETKVSALAQEKGVKGENELRQRIAITNR